MEDCRMDLDKRIGGWRKFFRKVAIGFLVVTVCSSPWILAWYKKQATITDIERLNGLAQSKYCFCQWPRFQFGPVDNVYFLGPQVDDRNLSVLQKVPDLRILNLTNTQVTDEGPAQLRQFSELNCLYIASVDLTQLVGPDATHRNSTPRITGKGLDSLKDLPNLQVIQLMGTDTTDQDLKSLAVLSKLVVLDLKDTKVTDAGVTELKKVLPHCRVVRR
jgi:hypothetical protein